MHKFTVAVVVSGFVVAVKGKWSICCRRSESASSWASNSRSHNLRFCPLGAIL